jgi:hypothetical protein
VKCYRIKDERKGCLTKSPTRNKPSETEGCDTVETELRLRIRFVGDRGCKYRSTGKRTCSSEKSSALDSESNEKKGAERTKETSERNARLSETVCERDVFGRRENVDENHDGGIGTSVREVTDSGEYDHSDHDELGFPFHLDERT